MVGIGGTLKAMRSVDNGKGSKHTFKQPKPYGYRIIRRIERGGRIFELHATRGWRDYKAGC